MKTDAAQTALLCEDIWAIMDEHQAKGLGRDLLLSDLLCGLTGKDPGHGRTYKCTHVWPIKSEPLYRVHFAGGPRRSPQDVLQTWLKENDFEVYQDGRATRVRHMG